jgi:hypothetical protein
MEGQIVPDPDRPQHLARARTGPFFMCGPGDPEGFLYRGTRNADGTRAGDQTALIDKLRGTGANCIYLQVVRSHGGDGDSTQNPFVNSDPSEGLDQDILSQWEDWFAEMDRAGITIFLILYDDSARIWNDPPLPPLAKGRGAVPPLPRGGEGGVGAAERAFIHEIVNRFEHHKNLIWCVAEEYAEAYSAARVSNIAAEIRAADYHRHPIAVHKNNGLDFSEFADDPNIDQFAIQYNVSTPEEVHAGIVSAWNAANGRYSLNLAEVADHGTGESMRKKNWAAAMAGALVMVLGMDIASTPACPPLGRGGEGGCDLRDCGRLVEFFESTNFQEMAPRDDLACGGAQYVLALPGDSYIAYASNLSGDIGLKSMEPGSYELRWFDVTNGTTVVQSNVEVAAGDRTWPKPAQIGNELAVYIARTGVAAQSSGAGVRSPSRQEEANS